jgi:sporulation protein YlmC with PRC-barrel domain
MAASPMRLELGTSVSCSDGKFGELADVVIDPVSRCVTHIVVNPHPGPAPARLVPVELAEGAGSRELSLRCTIEEATALDSVQDFAYLRLGELPTNDPDWDVGVEQVLAMPYYDASEFGSYAPAYDQSVSVSFDRIPKGTIEIRRLSAVTSSDGHAVGRVDGFLLGPASQITHLVLERGHVWRRREVTIPISAVAKVETDGVSVDLTLHELGELPTVRVRRRRR